MTVVVTVIIIVLALFVAWLFAMRPSSYAHPFEEQMKTYKYAHRGLHNDCETYPENSIPAFSAAVRYGYGIELDVRLSADGTPIVFHDDNLYDLTGNDTKISELSDFELKQVSLGDRTSKIPMLADVIRTVKTQVPLLIELKTDGENAAELTDAVMGALDGYEGVFAIQSFDPRVLKYLKKHYPEVMRGQIAGFLSELKALKRFALGGMLTNFMTKPDFISYNVNDVNKLSFKLLKGVFSPTLFAWTVNSPNEFRRCRRIKAIPIFDSIRRIRK